MRSIYLFNFLYLIVILSIQAQPKEIAVNYFFSTGDYMDDKLSSDQVLLNVAAMGSDYIYVKNFLDPVTRKKSDAAKFNIRIRRMSTSSIQKMQVHPMYSYRSISRDDFAWR